MSRTPSDLELFEAWWQTGSDVVTVGVWRVRPGSFDGIDLDEVLPDDLKQAGTLELTGIGAIVTMHDGGDALTYATAGALVEAGWRMV
jgi:hypothetical protein